MSEFANSTEIREAILKVKSTFDASRNKGDLNYLFDGIKLPIAPEKDIKADALIKDSSSSRFTPNDLQKNKAALVTLFK